MNCDKTGSSPIVFTDTNRRCTYGYEYAKSPSAFGGWFSGLKTKISQLVGISEWLNQLGIGDSLIKRTMSSPTTATSSRVGDEDSISYRSISLDDCAIMPEWDDKQWDFSASFLADLDSSHVWDDTLERQHFGPLKDLLTTGGTKAEGHHFMSITLMHPTWCDKCGDFIWGLLKQAYKCENCNYTCHDRCKELVTLDCRSASSSLTSMEFPSVYSKLLDGTLGTIPKGLQLPPLPLNSFLEDAYEKKDTFIENPLFSALQSHVDNSLTEGCPINETQQSESDDRQILRITEVYMKENTSFEWSSTYKGDELAKMIAMYNETSNGLYLKMNDDGETFSGHIQIHMNLSRPISVIAGEKPPTIYDVINTEKSMMSLRTITSFFLPRNTVKTINIDSKTTTRQMIVTLLRKFRVADNPRKFALYECTHENDTDTCTLLRKMTRIADDVCPLKVILSWQNANSGHALVLQENDTGDILWDAFEVPELDNFLRILRMEEQQYQWQIRQRYYQYRYYIDLELQRRGFVDGEYASEPPESSAPPPPLSKSNECGTSSSMIISDVYHTIQQEPLTSKILYDSISEDINDPVYVNLNFIKSEYMQQSTLL